MKRFLILSASIFFLSAFIAQGQVSYTWTPVSMNSDWDDIKDPAATEIIEKYAPQVASLQEIIAYSDEEYSKQRPESPLSNFAADVLREMGHRYTGKRVDVGLTNLGGIRTSLPKGAVRVYDIYSIFPFDNNIVVFEIKGSALRKIITKMVGSNKLEAISNVNLVIDGNKPVSIKIGKHKLKERKTYRFATLNFLMDGGDDFFLSESAERIISIPVWFRDAIVEYLKDYTAHGNTLSLKVDGRVKYIGEDE